MTLIIASFLLNSRSEGLEDCLNTLEIIQHLLIQHESIFILGMKKQV